MHFKTLENLTVAELTTLFNQAFADYFIKVELSADFMQEKIKSEDIILDKSVGVFVDEKPVAFILHALRNNVAYNAGTGVIPEFRGQHATVKMYNYILPKLKSEGVSEVLLEVIDENIQAIKSYKKVGFIIEQKLPCFKGELLELKGNTSVQITKIEDINLNLLESFWEWQPTWQQSTPTLAKLPDYILFGAFLNNKLVGYIYANVDLGRVAQFAVKPEFRKLGIGTSLFQYFAERCTCEIGVFNTDGNHAETHNFLLKIGLKHILSQNKMILKL